MAESHIGAICADSKTCRVCGESKSTHEFWKLGGGREGVRNECKACCRTSNRRWKDDNEAEHKRRSREYREAMRHQMSAYLKKYNRRPEVRARKRELYRQKWESDAGFRLNAIVKLAFRRAIRREYEFSDSMVSMLGYFADDLRNHLKAQFRDGMSWENYGRWEVDHIRPLSSFSFETADDPMFRMAWALDNLQPLWAHENLTKGAKWAA